MVTQSFVRPRFAGRAATAGASAGPTAAVGGAAERFVALAFFGPGAATGTFDDDDDDDDDDDGGGGGGGGGGRRAGQAGTFSRNFSFTMRMIDITCAKLAVEGSKCGQR